MWPFSKRCVDNFTLGAAAKSPHLSAILQSATFFCSSFEKKNQTIETNIVSLFFEFEKKNI